MQTGYAQYMHYTCARICLKRFVIQHIALAHNKGCRNCKLASFKPVCSKYGYEFIGNLVGGAYQAEAFWILKHFPAPGAKVHLVVNIIGGHIFPVIEGSRVLRATDRLNISGENDETSFLRWLM